MPDLYNWNDLLLAWIATDTGCKATTFFNIFSLLGIILVEIVSILTNSHNYRFISYIVIAIFIGYLL